MLRAQGICRAAWAQGRSYFRHAPVPSGSGRFSSRQDASRPIPAADPEHRPTLRRGSKGQAVEQAQALLGIDVDGFFGANTEAALRAFQRKGGLVPDGILGPKSWEALPRAEHRPVLGPHPPRPQDQRPDPQNLRLHRRDLHLCWPPRHRALPPPDTPAHKPTLSGRKAFGPGGKPFAIAQGPGFFTIGETTLGVWLDRNPRLPATISKSAQNVVAAMSVVEGGLEAVNSYDAAHLSFGVFQWTAGVGDAEGELAVLLAQFKAADPAGFQECFGQYELDATVKDAKATTGRLSLGGTLLRTSAQKEVLRKIGWAYQFWRAGHHEGLRTCQFTLAASRIDRFAMVSVHGKPLRDWMSSELAVALILDEHVNRPGHVPSTLLTRFTRLVSRVPIPPNGRTSRSIGSSTLTWRSGMRRT